MPKDVPPLDRHAIVEQLERMLSSASFRRAGRSSVLLRYLVEQTIDGHADRLKEYTLGAEALGRGSSFDPRTDPIVRAEASRLRARLEQYYTADGRADTVVIELPKGSYVPQLSRRVPTSVAAAAGDAPIETRRRGRFGISRPVWLLVVGIGLIGALASARWTRPDVTPPDGPSMAQFEVELKSDGVLGSEVGTDVQITPDGTRVVYVSRDANGLAHLNTRRLDQPQSVRLPGTDGARGPFISPDGRWVGFWAEGKVKKASVDGASPVILCNANDLLGASWGEDGDIIAALNPTGRLWRIPATGGTPTVVLDLSAESATPVWPQVLPGGESLLYTVNTAAGADRATIELLSLRTGTRTVLVRGGTFGRYLSTGHLTYVNQGTLYAVRFDVRRGAVDGASIPVVHDVSYSRTFGYAQMDVSGTGTLVYRRGAEGAPFVAGWLDRSGTISPLLTKPGQYAWLRVSPDGRRVATAATESGATNIVIHDVQNNDAKRLSTTTAEYGGLLWWPLGNRLVFGGANGMHWIDTARPESSGSLTTSRVVQVPWSVGPDGRLAYYEMNPDTGFDLWTIPVGATDTGLQSGTPELFLRTRAFEVYPAFSSDGRWLAYASNESGAFEVYVRRFPDDGTTVKVSKGGGSTPRWLPNGRELVYRRDNQQIMVASYRLERNELVPGPSRPWPSPLLADTGVLPNFDLAHDGARIAALMPATRPEVRQSPDHVTIMLNFTDEVRRRAATR